MEKYTGFHYTPLKTAWGNLSQAEKAEIIKVAVKNNITDLKTIRQKYNEFAEGSLEKIVCTKLVEYRGKRIVYRRS